MIEPGQDLPSELLVAISIAISDEETPHQLHVGVVYLDGGDQRSLMHLAWHRILCNEDVDPKAFVFPLRMDRARQLSVSAMCRRVWRSNEREGVPYGFTPPNRVFSETDGQLLLGPTETGLTCATFVLAVLQSSRIRLLAIEKWPPANLFDQRWQKYIAETLRHTTIESAHAQAVLDEQGCARIRPEQVAAATLQQKHPATHGQVDRDAQNIALIIFNRHCDRLLDGMQEPAYVRRFVNLMYLKHGLVPKAVQFGPSNWISVRFPHPFRRHYELVCKFSPKLNAIQKSCLRAARSLQSFSKTKTSIEDGRPPESIQRTKGNLSDLLEIFIKD